MPFFIYVTLISCSLVLISAEFHIFIVVLVMGRSDLVTVVI